MTSKNDLGSIPCAELKSVPVFLSDCMAARIPCTAATQDTREKTVKKMRPQIPFIGQKPTNNFSTVCFSLFASERWRKATRYNIDEDGFGGQCLHRLSKELSSLDTLDEANIGTGISRELQTSDGFIHAKDLSGICAADNNLRIKESDMRSQDDFTPLATHEVGTTRNGISGDHGSTNTSNEFFPRNNLLSHQVTATLSLDLVLNVHTSYASTSVLVDGASDHSSPTETIMVIQVRTRKTKKIGLRTQYQHQR